MKIDSTGVSFDVSGTGDTVLFLHAFPLSSAMWKAQAQALSGGRRVVCMDTRGFGASDAITAPTTMETIAQDAAAVLDHLGVPRAVLCGCSMGGYAALAFAHLFPQRLQALVLVDTKAAADTEEARTGRTTLAEKVLKVGAGAAAEAMMPKLLGSTSHRERPDLVARVREWILGASPQGIASALLGLGARADRRPLLAQIRVPALIIRGEEDAVISAADAQELHAGIAGSQTLAIPRAGHLPSLETPAELTSALATFLDSLAE